MNMMQKLHVVRLCKPFYQSRRNSGLHRYLDPDFVNRFKHDLQRQQFDQPQFNDWIAEESRKDRPDEPVLRLPLHRAFHLVSCEVVCDHHLGRPALDPEKITSAGFVIRKRSGADSQAWMLEDGQALGWQNAPTQLSDPDIYRRLCACGALHKRADEPSYSGEEVHPLHVHTVHDAKGKRHTLLYGYVPLGGFYYAREPAKVLDQASQDKALSAAQEALLWPYGYRDALDRRSRWRTNDAIAVERGRPGKAFFTLLQQLVQSYHLGESDQADNKSLEQLARQLWFYDLRSLPSTLNARSFNELSKVAFNGYRRYSLWDYLRVHFQRSDQPLVDWIIRVGDNAAKAGGIEKLGSLPPLPAARGTGVIDEWLLLDSSDAQNLRNQLDQRLLDQTLTKVKELPLPKFTQGANDLYQIIPFVRHKNKAGKEQIAWGDASARSIWFRVAAPHDPESTRPSLIQMPSLSDLRKGLAQGASIITPGDTFNLIKALKLNKGVSPDLIEDPPEPGPDTGIQWICSFSIPVITLVAMILLMIMISLLNIVFFWLPWVRICLPFPKFK